MSEKSIKNCATEGCGTMIADDQGYDRCLLCTMKKDRDTITISRESAQYLFSQMEHGQTIYVAYDAATKLFDELKAALEVK